MSIEDLHARNVAEVNARMAADGRCIMHNHDVNIPARYVVRFPIGNEVPVCIECCAFIRREAAENPDDEWSQPEWIREIA